MTARWYVVHAHSTFENKIADHIREQAALKGISDCFEEILVPTEEVIDVKQGKKVSKEKRLYPGYMLVKMNMTDEAWRLVTSNSKVTGFLGTANRPTPISESEAKRLLQQLEDGVGRSRASIQFDVGEEVRVVDGPFVGFNGIVDEVDMERFRLRVTVQIFERDTPVDLEYKQVEKI